ncbi:hypothetical protein TNCV_1880771 [Trichonephila clavipes]|nr:hypothetical protein TNCV_1880771 [Trichonephila clavipes]
MTQFSQLTRSVKSKLITWIEELLQENCVRGLDNPQRKRQSSEWKAKRKEKLGLWTKAEGKCDEATGPLKKAIPEVFDCVLFAGREQTLPVERASDKLAGSCSVESGAVFNMFAIAAISSRQTIVNKYLQNNKGVNWNGFIVDNFVIVACVAGSVVEACVVHQS